MEYTFESVLQLIAENERSFLARVNADRAAFEVRHTAFEARQAAYEADRLVRDAAFEELRRRGEEEYEALRKEGDKIRKEADEAKKEADKARKELDRKFGKLTDKLGEFAQYQAQPGIQHFFRAMGHPIIVTIPNLIGLDKNEDLLYEIDLLLHNTDLVAVIETKLTLRMDDLEAHQTRIERFVAAPVTNIEGKRVVGGFGAMIAPKHVVKAAEKMGLYVFLPDSDNMKPANSKGFKPRVWNG